MLLLALFSAPGSGRKRFVLLPDLSCLHTTDPSCIPICAVPHTGLGPQLGPREPVPVASGHSAAAPALPGRVARVRQPYGGAQRVAMTQACFCIPVAPYHVVSLCCAHCSMSY